MNPQQLAAVFHHHDGPLLVLAAAGTGKTEVLTRRIAHFVGAVKVPANNVLAVTFSNRAAREMRERAARLCGMEEDDMKRSVSTFHSTCVRILRMHSEWSDGFTILDTTDAVKVLHGELLDMAPDHTAKPTAVYAWLNKWRNDGLEPDDVTPPTVGNIAEAADEPAESLAYRVYRAYRKACRRNREVDFADLLCHAVRLCQKDDVFLAQLREKWTHVLVDEFQDTNAVQLELVKLIVGKRTSVTVVGDDCQTIHEHAGASADRILRFPDEFPGTVTIKLEQNYRSTPPILELANNVIRNNVTRVEKTLIATLCDDGLCSVDGVPLTEYEDEVAEARGVVRMLLRARKADPALRLSDVCILYRINALSGHIESELKRAGLPHRIVGSTAFFDRAEVRDAVAYIMAAANPYSEVHVLRAVGSPPKGVGPTTLQRAWDVMADGGQGEEGDDTKTRAGACNKNNNKRNAGMLPIESYFSRKVEEDDLLPCSTSPSATTIDNLPAAMLAILPKLSGRASTGVRTLLDALDFDADHPFHTGSRQHDSVDGLVMAVVGIVQRSGLEKYLRDKGETERAENVQALLGMVRRLAEEHCPTGGTLHDLLQHMTVAQPEPGGRPSDGAESDVLTLMSVHRSKGLEWTWVHVVGFADGCLPFKMSIDEGHLEGERRLAYVAVTRAKRRISFSYPKSRTLFWGRTDQTESRFAAEMEEGCAGGTTKLRRESLPMQQNICGQQQHQDRRRTMRRT